MLLGFIYFVVVNMVIEALLNVGLEIRTRLKSEWKVKMCKHHTYKNFKRGRMIILIYKYVLRVSTKCIKTDRTIGFFYDARYSIRYYPLYMLTGSIHKIINC